MNTIKEINILKKALEIRKQTTSRHSFFDNDNFGPIVACN